MNKKMILFILTVTFTFAENKRLSFDDVQGKSPFKYSSLGIITWFPDENAFLTKDNNNFYKVSRVLNSRFFLCQINEILNNLKI